MSPIAFIFIFTALLAIIGFGFWKFYRDKHEELEKISRKKPFIRNERAIKSLKLNEDELIILNHLSEGHSNQEIADKTSVSINAVKHRLSSVYKKLDVNRRSKAVKKAKSLKLIPA